MRELLGLRPYVAFESSPTCVAPPFLIQPGPRLLSAEQDYQVRAAAIETLGWIGPGARSAIPELTKIACGSLESEEPQKALKALKKIGPESIESLEYVEEHSPDKEQQELSRKLLTELHQNKFPSIQISLKDGPGHEMHIRNDVIVMAAASWCPYSKRLKEFLLREDVKPCLQNFTLLFLMEDETDEVLAHVQNQLEEEHKDWSNDRKQELLQTIKAQISTTGYFDPSFATTLPGEHLQVASLQKLYSSGFPEVLSPALIDSDFPKPTKSSWMNVHEHVAAIRDVYRDDHL